MAAIPPERSQILLAALSDAPASTSELYERVGYPRLLRAGLIEYAKFRDALAGLAAAGLAERSTGHDGATLWRRPALPEGQE